MKGWHFTPLDRRLTHGDGRLVVAGETLSVPASDFRPGGVGLYACESLLAAVSMANGGYLWRVDLSDDNIHFGDGSQHGIMVSDKRTALWGFNAVKLLLCFSAEMAAKVNKQSSKEWLVRVLCSRPDTMHVDVSYLARALVFWTNGGLCEWAESKLIELVKKEGYSP